MRVHNVGSLNIDFVYDVSHFVTKGETLSSDALHVYPGGKGLNQSVALARAGAEVAHVGRVGADGAFLVDLLEGEGVDVRGVLADAEARTGSAIVQRDPQGDNCILLHGGANRALGHPWVRERLSAARQGDLVLLQNEVNDIGGVIGCARALGLEVVLNPSPVDETLLSADLSEVGTFVLNEVEAAMLVGLPDTAPTELLDAMARAFPGARVFLTVGERGSLFYADGRTGSRRAFGTDVVDTTAAGDTYTGYLLA